MKRILLVVVAAALLAGCSHKTPAGQPPMATMDLGNLRAEFNHAADRPRLILLLSPT
ncbi:MAG: hypothetical protein JWP63_4837 [Candidatus Solibacter sp.]|nr:hypothetical protein [Candidatus Solibacter sp.]